MATSVSVQIAIPPITRGATKHYMQYVNRFAHGTAWAALFHARMDVCNRYGLPSGNEIHQ